jgi:hypothetical protein
LSEALKAPFYLLCVLHTSRTGAELGRYQSSQLDRSEVARFFDQFGPLFAEDARFDVWLHTRAPQGTLVLDRFNLVYAYGPMAAFELILENAGIQRVASWAAPSVPYPHVLNYHNEFDASEAELLGFTEWRWTPLHHEDVQHWSGPQSL